MRSICAAALVGLLAPPSVAAQICAGRASFDSAALQLRGAGTISVSQRAAGLTVARGTDRLFAQAAAHVDSRSPVDRYALSTAIGTDQPLTADNRLHACPVVGIAYGWRPSSGRDVASLELLVGGSIGLLAVNTASAAVIPTVGIGWHRGYRYGPATSGSGRSSFSIGAALGVVLRRRVAFRPGVVLPLGGGPRPWSVTAEVSLNVPRR